MQIGEYVETPRFLKVNIAAIFNSMELAKECGFIETTHYWDDPEWDILGKHIGINRMIFGAIKKQ